MNKIYYLSSLIALMVLVGCSSDSDKAEKKPETKIEKQTATKLNPICPQVAIVRDLQSMKDYGGEAAEPSQLVAQARLQMIDGDCAYIKKDAKDGGDGIDIRFSVNFVAERGPRLGGLRVGFPYFIAVVDPDEHILNKDLVTKEFHFSSTSSEALDSDNLHVFIPLSRDKVSIGPSYQVLVGFQLRKEQLNAERGESVSGVTP